MEIKAITHSDFEKYGHVVEGYNFTQLITTMEQVTQKPQNEVIYVPGEKALESLDIAKAISQNLYGGMPVQVGYCNGSNHVMNCLEYHRGSEMNIAADDVILLLAPKQKIQNGKLDTAHVEAFLLPAGTAVLLYETTLHYAPCNGNGNDGFRVAIVLPKNTNTEKPQI